ncbi:hypothetical protein P6O77_15560, partial [Clostridium perfringens]|nr:hypothetical protein [Clostridium perfringens]
MDFDTDGAAAGDTTGLAEGSWYLHVKAEDAAGNLTSATSRAFDMDQASPTLAETGIGVGTTVNRGAGFTLSGSSSDTH